MEERSYYSIIPAPVKCDKMLTDKAKLLYGDIAGLSNEKGYCFATNAFFAEIYGIAKENISRLISQLEKAGHIKTEIIYAGKEIKERRIYINQQYLLTKITRGIDENIKTPIDENIKDTNTYITNTITNTNITPLISPRKVSSIKDTLTAMIKNSSFSEKVKTSLSLWLQYKNYAYKEIGFKSLLSIAAKNLEAYDEDAVCDLIEECMSNGWVGIIWDKLEKRNPKPKKEDKSSVKYSKGNYL